MLDLNQLALTPGVERLAAVLRSDFNVWVGLVGPDGANVPLGAATTPIRRPVCSIFMANGSKIEEGPTTCSESLLAWGASVNELSTQRCHAGFRSLILPIQHEGKAVANVYISGYFHAEEAAEQVHRLKRKMRAIDVADIESYVDALPILTLRDRDLISGIARAIVSEITAALDRSEQLEIEASETAFRYANMIGESDKMLTLFKTLKKISSSQSTILIQGENGTGKELIARAIHAKSSRRNAPFVVQNCAAIPAELIESELFGHRKGAFSGAHRDRTGLFEYADHGTFFLDEIGEMDLAMQVKLLRVLQEGTFLPVGDNTYRKVDVRLICATNRDLREEVKAGRFREDLFYRINVITVTAPPLRHRRDDIELLARHFLAKSCREHGRPLKQLTKDAYQVLREHPWPGNVRELENEIERLVILSGDDDLIDKDAIQLRVRERDLFDEVELSSMSMPDAIEQLERRMILEGLQRTGWNKTQTAKDLGVSRRNLIRKVATYELERNRS